MEASQSQCGLTARSLHSQDTQEYVKRMIGKKQVKDTKMSYYVLKGPVR